MIGAVVPVYNRRDNLELLLTSLECQGYTDFHVVIADDGSTDGTRELVEEQAGTRAWGRRLRWVGCGPNRGVRTGRARNIGTANLEPGSGLLVMLDSDLVLQPDAMAGFAAAHSLHPVTVLLGLVEWLPPLGRHTVQTAVIEGSVAALRQHVPRRQPARVEGTFTGPELRAGLFDLGTDQAVSLRPEWALPLNSAWPVDLYWEIGGFDETMCGYGYQDMEFGARAAKAGAVCRARPELWALHVWHPKPAGSMVENQRNLDFYLRRHGANRIIETDVDWTLWWHYHAERGGTVIRHNSQLWALNGARDRRLAIPDTSWLRRLGHCGHLIEEADPHAQTTAQDCGIAYDPTSP
ncbi:MAG: glycosyltransferase family 2 protein [Pseudonocardiaceae bacterium]